MRTESYLGLFDSLADAPITVRPERCVLVRNRHATCNRCAQACPTECISVVGGADGRVTIEPERCVGCGTCATVCPTGALEPVDPTDRELYELCVRAMGADGRLTVACEHAAGAALSSQGEKGAVVVRCLGRVDESLLALLARAGAREVALVCGHCGDCRRRPGRVVAERVCETANALLAVWGQRPLAHLEERASVEGRTDVDARETVGAPAPATTGDARGTKGALADAPAGDARGTRGAPEPAAVGDACETGAEPADATAADVRGTRGAPAPADGVAPAPPCHVKADGTLPHALPNRRNRLLQALNSAFGEPDSSASVKTRLWGRAVIDTDACRTCLACAVFCPTEALHKVVGEDGSVSLLHYPSRCVKCGCCADVCPTDALTLLDEVRAGDLRPGACERYELPPRARARGPHQMRDAMVSLLGVDFVYER